LARINPLLFQCPASRPYQVKKFTDPAQPGVDIIIRLGALETDKAYMARDEAQQLIAYYVTGTPKHNLKVGNAFVSWSEWLCRSVADLYYMQPARLDRDIEVAFDPASGAQNGDENPDLFTSRELAALCKSCPTAWVEMQQWAMTLDQEAEKSAEDPTEDSTAD
jgi:hypothetical protein